MNTTILAIDLGKYNSVSCHYEPDTKRAKYRTIRTTPDEMRKLLARIVYGLVKHGWEYVRRTEQDYTNDVRARLEKNLHRRARELGFEVVKRESPPPEALPVAT